MLKCLCYVLAKECKEIKVIPAIPYCNFNGTSHSTTKGFSIPPMHITKVAVAAVRRRCSFAAPLEDFIVCSSQSRTIPEAT